MVVNYNRADLTHRCLETVHALDWPEDRLEVVVVDNGSTNGGVAEIAESHGRVEFRKLPRNLGFGGGCNAGVRDALRTVDYIALVNNDVELPREWLRPLVDALAGDPRAGAASPKVLLTGQFIDLHIESPRFSPGGGDPRQLGVMIDRIRIDGRDAWRDCHFAEGFWAEERNGESPFRWTSGPGRLLVPAPANQLVEIRLVAPNGCTVRASQGQPSSSVPATGAEQWHAVVVSRGVDIVNNAGVALLSDGGCGDRGFLDADDGRYDTPGEVFAWSGAAVLLSSRYLEEVGMFDTRFFLYYEDVDLSWRGRRQGWRYLYVPASVARHQHSATVETMLHRTAHLPERNRLLVLTRNAPIELTYRELVAHFRQLLTVIRNDFVDRLRSGRQPLSSSTTHLLRVLAGYLRHAPAIVLSRLAPGSPPPLRTAEVFSWIEHDFRTDGVSGT